MVNEEVYSNEFFENQTIWRERYFEMANWLWLNFKPEKVIDFGCGNGFIISMLKRCGASVIGVEGSSNALKHVPENVKGDVRIADITRPLNFGKYDLVISSEVAEHLPANSADVFLDNLTSHTKSVIFFTAAEPGQTGTHHINEQPHEYWIEKFNIRGFVLLEDKTQNMRKYLTKLWKQYGLRGHHSPRHFTSNLMFFRRASEEDAAMINHQLIVQHIGLILPIYLIRYLIHVRPLAFLNGIRQLPKRTLHRH